MKLKVLLPADVLLEREVSKITAEAENGSFCLLEHHVDFVAALVPGLFSLEDAEGQQEYIALDEGILVKCGAEVLVSTRNAVRGGDLGQLRETVEEQYRTLDERERLARSAGARLEADLVRRFMELEHHGR